MKRKDCDKPKFARESRCRRHIAARVRLAALCAVMITGTAGDALAGSVRLWPDAVVTDDQINLTDVCELRDFDADTERHLHSLKVGDAPPNGGSRFVHLDMIRAALVAGGANLAEVTLRGATQCAVTRPAELSPARTADSPMSARGTDERRIDAQPMGAATSGRVDSPNGPSLDSPYTLRRAVIDYFTGQFERYGGRSEVLFDRASDQVLNLSGPSFEFRVRHKRGTPLGLLPIDVDILAGGELAQTVPLVVQVSMIRHAVVARRSINQDASVRPADVERTAVTFTQLDRLGLDRVAQTVGQRAKQFVPAGTIIRPEMLEAVPLVRRGELVTLSSVAGGVRIETTAKAAETGLLGDVVTVRSLNDRRIEFDAIVVGPGAVQIGGDPRQVGSTTLALGVDG